MANYPELRVFIIAGEASSDALAAGLITGLKKRITHLTVEGIAGPKMLVEGTQLFASMRELAVMGIFEVIPHLCRLLSLRRRVYRHLKENPPDLFIGVDAPDFNLSLERKLKKLGIPVVHYVSPSIWAWRKGRINLISQAVDRMLTLFPFETDLYHQHHIPVSYVGHPFADEIPWYSDKESARHKLVLSENVPTLGLFPGSREMELKSMGPLFLKTAKWCQEKIPNLQCVVALGSEKLMDIWNQMHAEVAPDVTVRLFSSPAREVMAACDVLLVKSGTITLEAMLVKRPMVIAYRMSWFSFWLLRCLVRIKFVGLPNILSKRLIVPECLQGKATPHHLGSLLMNYLNDDTSYDEQMQSFTHWHERLQCNTNEKATDAVLETWQITIKKNH